MASCRIASRIVLRKSPLSFRLRCLSTEPHTDSDPVSTKLPLEKTLYQKLSPLAHQNASETDISQILNEWNKTYKPLQRNDIIRCIKKLRSRKDYHLSLNLIRWMETNDLGELDADRALEIDLLGKTEGVKSAETYFDNLEQSAKTNRTCGALFGCYCKGKYLDKALELFEKMKEQGFVTTLNYNNLISLYLKVDQPRMVASVVEEMEQTSVCLDSYTYNLLIKSFAAIKDFDAMEGVLEKMKSNGIKYDWFTYGNLANIYINVGLLDKASSILKKMENKKHQHNEETSQTMIDIYSRTENLPGIYSAWESLKSTCSTPSNKSYLIMLLSLFKMGESESVEKYFKEWEAGCSIYDVRLSNVLLKSYLNRDMIGEANMLYESVQKRGQEPNLKACELLTNFYIKKGEINLALKYLNEGVKIAIPRKQKWFPTDETIEIFLEYFKKSNDTENAKIFIECVKMIDRIDSAVYESLVGHLSLNGSRSSFR